MLNCMTFPNNKCKPRPECPKITTVTDASNIVSTVKLLYKYKGQKAVEIITTHP